MWQLRWGSFGPSPREWPLVSIHMPTFFANDYPRPMQSRKPYGRGGEGRGGGGGGGGLRASFHGHLEKWLDPANFEP